QNTRHACEVSTGCKVSTLLPGSAGTPQPASPLTTDNSKKRAARTRSGRLGCVRSALLAPAPVPLRDNSKKRGVALAHRSGGRRLLLSCQARAGTRRPRFPRPPRPGRAGSRPGGAVTVALAAPLGARDPDSGADYRGDVEPLVQQAELVHHVGDALDAHLV